MADTRELGDVEERGGRLAAAPSVLEHVPQHLRVEQRFGWGWPTFGIALACGALYQLGVLLTRPKPADPVGLAILAVAALLGVVCVGGHVRAVRRRMVLVPTERGVAIYRDAKLLAQASRGDLKVYVHSVFNTLYLLAVLGFVLFMAASFGGTDPTMIAAVVPTVAVLASSLRSRFAFTHLYVMRGEGTSMFPTTAFTRAFGDVQRWA